MKKIIFTVAIGLFLVINILAQSLDNAHFEFEKFHYKKASELYEAFLMKPSDKAEINQKVQENLATCYRKMNDAKNAEKWYAVVITNPNTDPINKMYYAQFLAQNQKYEESKKMWYEYAIAVKSDKRGKDFSKSYQDVDKYFQDADRYTVEPAPFNSKQADFSPTYYQGGVVFCSNRELNVKELGLSRDFDKKYRWNGMRFYDLYYSGGGVGVPKFFSKKLNTPYHEGPANFYNDDNAIVFTRNNYDKGKIGTSEDDITKMKLFFATKSGDDWTNIIEFPYNDKEYTVQHPAMSPDGNTLYFASDMPGTHGGMDIFKCTWTNGAWGRPVNLGVEINTKGNEVFPYMDKSNNLYFASDGWAGLGGLDIFIARNKDGKYINPYNVGAPLNSSKDDFGVIYDTDNNEGYFTSNRDGGQGDDDIYKFSIKSCKVIVVVQDEVTKEIIKLPKLVIQETASNGEVVYLAESETAFSFKTNFRTGYQMRGTKEGYNEGTSTLTEEQVLKCKNYNGTLSDTVYIGIRRMTDLEREKIAKLLGKKPSDKDLTTKLTKNYKDNPNIKVIELVNVYYDLDKYNIRPDASRDLDKVLAVLQEYPNMRVGLSSHTDSRDTYDYNVKLSQRRSTSARQYLIDRGIAPDRLEIFWFGETTLVTPCPDGINCSEPDHQLNRRTEVAILEYINPPKNP
ncbi:MAG: OmpA family protein [Cytophagales bacterium]|nr:MAG: OmpA family protein [Cytophagales bacterium]TAH28908.1 MAG: OmpA family protein [Cytophagales bacterium]